MLWRSPLPAMGFLHCSGEVQVNDKKNLLPGTSFITLASPHTLLLHPDNVVALKLPHSMLSS